MKGFGFECALYDNPRAGEASRSFIDKEPAGLNASCSGLEVYTEKKYDATQAPKGQKGKIRKEIATPRSVTSTDCHETPPNAAIYLAIFVKPSAQAYFCY